MFHFVYKITNTIDGKFYIGKHSTNNLNDGYMGSGVLIRNAIKKHGISNFRREIIFEALTSEEAFNKETELLTVDLVTDPLCYNLMIGNCLRNIASKIREKVESKPPELNIPIRSRFNPEVKFVFKTIPEQIKAWEDSFTPGRINMLKALNGEENFNFFMKVTQMTIRGFDGLLRGIEYSYNRKGTHRKALKAIGLMEQKNTRDCFEIVESNWDFTA